MRLRRCITAVVLTATVLLPGVSGTAAWAKPSAKPAAAKSAKLVKVSKHAKPVKVKFAASGVITAVNKDAGSFSLRAKGGTKDVKGHIITVTAPSTARVILDDAPATLADLVAGYRITVTGTRLGTVYSASKIQASSPEPVQEPSIAPTPEPSTTPTTAPTE